MSHSDSINPEPAFPAEFFDMVFQNTIQGNSLDVELRLRKGKKVQQRFYRSKRQIEKDWRNIQGWNRHLGYDVDFTIVPRKRYAKKGHKEHKLPNPLILNCFWADTDVGHNKPFASRKAARKRIVKVGPKPNILVWSGQGMHAYYCLRRPTKIPVARAESLLEALTAKLQGDSQAAHAKRLMRLPHTINHKRGKLVRYKIIRRKGHSLQRLERHWEAGKSEAAVNAGHEHGRYIALFRRVVPDLKVAPNGVWAQGTCPFHHDRHPSFYLNVEDGRWGCHAEGCRKKGSAEQFGPAIGALLSGVNGSDGGKLLRWKDIPLASEATEENLQWLAAARIPAKQVTVIAAHKDSYKTMLMLALAKAAISEGEFLGRRTKQMRVLYLNREMPKAVFDSYCKTLNLDKSNRRFKILSSLWDTGIKPPTPGDKLLRRFAKRYKPLMIFDSFIRFFPGRMEDPKAINNFMEQLNELAALGATVVILHHLPKHDAASEGYGSVYILNGADFGWRIAIEGEKYGSEENRVLKIQNTKTKMGDYFSIKVRPLLKTTGDFKVLDEHSQWKEDWERDVKVVQRLFDRTEYREKRKAQKEAMGRGLSRQRFKEVFDFCEERGLLRVKKGPKGLRKCRRAKPDFS